VTVLRSQLPRWTAFLLAFTIPLLSTRADKADADTGVDVDAAIAEPPPASVPLVEGSLRRGLDFLYEAQNKDGSWGSPRRTKGLNIYAPVPGSHHAFKAGTTALALSGILDCQQLVEVDTRSLDRAEAWLLATLPNLRRADAQALYNVWGHAYGLEALARMARRHADDPTTLSEIQRAMDGQIDLLTRFSMVNGGWGYYDMGSHTKQPGGSPTSFTTAAALVGLREAEKWGGATVPRPLVRKALASIARQQIPDGSFTYGEYLRMRPRHEINRPGGSLGRSLSCFVAQRAWDDPGVDFPADHHTWLQRLFDRNLWLDIGRKRPVPHESHFAVAGYFFYFGHYYGALAIDDLADGDAKKPGFQSRMATILTRLQETDGSWWDYPLYDYHQAYGTGFALQSLVRCHPDWQPGKPGA